MPFIQKQWTSTTLPKQNHRRMKTSVYSCTDSSTGSLSDDSLDTFKRHQHRNTADLPCVVPLGTLVKKYFKGRGWYLGKVINLLPCGDYEVKYDVEDEPSIHSYTYSYSRIIRLKRTASVRKGTKISIYWPQDDKYYTAIITKELPRKKENYLVCYCHNTVEREWIDLHRHKFRILVPSSSFNDTVQPTKSLLSHDVTSALVVENRIRSVGQSARTDGILQDDNNVTENAPTYNEVSLEQLCMEYGSDNVNLDSKFPSYSNEMNQQSRVKLSVTSDLGDNLHLAPPDSFSEQEVSKNLVSREVSLENDFSNSERSYNGIVKQERGFDLNDEDDIVSDRATLVHATTTINFCSNDIIMRDNFPSSKVSDNDCESDNMDTSATDLLDINVGTRIEVYWSDDLCYYGGMIKKRRVSSNGKQSKDLFFLVYDDNESEWIDLRNHTYRIISCSSHCADNVISSDCVETGDDYDLLPQHAVDKVSGAISICCNENCSEEESNMLHNETGIQDENACKCTDNMGKCEDTSTIVDSVSVALTNVVVESNQDCRSVCDTNVVHYDESDSNVEINHVDASMEVLPCSSFSSKYAVIDGMEVVDSIESSRNSEETGSNPTRTNNSSPTNIFITDQNDSSLAVAHSDTGNADFDRGSRKAALEALVRKKKILDEESGDDVDASTPCIEGDPCFSDDEIQQDSSKIEKNIFHDVSNLQEGVKVAVWCSQSKKFIPGTIIEERENSARYCVRYDADQRNEWIDFMATEFKILKRKRGRPKKAPLLKMEKKTEVEDQIVIETNPRKDRVLVGEDSVILPINKLKLMTRVAIYWERDGKFHVGTIVQERSKGKPYRVEYDDDDWFEWLDFKEQRYKILEQDSTTIQKRKRSNAPGDVSQIQVGSHIEIWWEGEAKYCAGVVAKIRENTRPFWVVYDDGQASHWVDLEVHKFRFLSGDDSMSEDQCVQFTTSKKRKLVDNPSCDLDFKEEYYGRRNEMDKHERDILLSQLSVGKQIEILNARDNTFYPSLIIDTGYLSGRFLIRNENDEKVWVDLKTKQFRLLLPKEDIPETQKSKLRKENKSSDDIVIKETVSSESSDTEKCGVYIDEDNDFVYGDVEKVRVGTRIAIWWPRDKVYYGGKIAKITEGRTPYFIKYDDNDEEWTDLRKRYFRILDKK